MTPRFEVVRTAAGYHARFRAENGRIVWFTEVYTRRAAATRAVDILESFVGGFYGPYIEVRDIDERAAS
jgi:uncharacterized protein YegP (UPF0339 family)